MGQFDQLQAKVQASPDREPPARTDHEPKAVAISGAQADRMIGSVTGHAGAAGPSRLSPMADRHEFGEQVVGSHGAARIRAPWNLSDQEAVARFSVAGDGFALVSSPTLTLPPSRTMAGLELDLAERASPLVVYRPTRPGSHDGTLTVSVGWNLDGHVETRTIALHGRARTLEQAPSHETPSEAIAEEAEHAKRHAQDAAADERAMAAERRNPGPYNDEFNTAVGLAGIAAAGLARAQRRGLAIVKDEAAAYHRRVENAPRSIWLDLAEIALTVATAGVASHVAKNLLPRLLASEVAHDVAGLGGATRTASVPAKIGEFTTDAIKEGIKQAGKRAIQAAGAATDGGPGGSARGHSTSAHIDFFARQQKILDLQEGHNSASLLQQAQHLRPLLHASPDRAIAVMRRITEQLDASAEDAEQQQANAVAPRWATLVARMSLGAQAVVTAEPGEVPLQAVRTESLRASQPGGAPRPVDGVLDVHVERARPPAVVTGATLHGASQPIADRIGGLVLSEVGMPVRFVIGPRDAAPAIVTRDDAGRVRVHDVADEASAIQEATALIDRLLARSLAAWGVAVRSDDDPGHHG